MSKLEVSGLIFVLWLGTVAHLSAADLNGAEQSAAAESKQGLPVLARRVMDLSAQAKPAEALVITNAALLSRDAVPGVFVLEHNEARFRMVRLGKRSAHQVEILSGLFGNEILLIGDLETVHDGSPIKIIK